MKIKFTQRDRRELHNLIQGEWCRIYGNGKKTLTEVDKEYLDYLTRLHEKIDFIEDFNNE
jgi:hypothetical protein